MATQSSKKTIVRFRHRFWNKFLRMFAAPFIARHYRYRHTLNHLAKKGPFLIFSNHTCDMDPILLGTSFNFPIYYVASDQILNQGMTSTLLRYFFAPIGKTKSMPDMALVPTIKKIINQGGSVGIFVEGNVTLTGETVSIPPGTGKLIKFVNRPVILYVNQGLFFSDPRWSRHRKYGRTRGSIKRVLTLDEIAEKSAEELSEIVSQTLYVNAYDESRNISFRGKRRAEGLERLVFACPRCHDPFHMQSDHDRLSCSACGFSGVYDEHGYLQSDLGAKTLIDLNVLTLQTWITYLREHPQVTLHDRARIFFAYGRGRKRPYLGPHQLELNAEGITVRSETSAKHYDFATILSFAMQRKDKLIVYLRDGPTLFIRFPRAVSVYRYLVTMQLFHNQYLYQKGETKDDYFHDADAYRRLGL